MGPGVRLGLLEDLDERGQAVALDGTDVPDAELLEDEAWEERLLDELLEGPAGLDKGPADLGDALEDGLGLVFHLEVMLARRQIGEVLGPGAHVGRNGHLVVVEDDDEPLPHVADLVEGLEGRPARQASVADDGDDVEVLLLLVPGHGHAQGGRQGRRGVAGVEDVVRALLTGGEAEQAVEEAEAAEPVPPAGEDLVGVALVADVPDELVPGRVEDVVQGQGQLDHPEVRGEVAAVLRDRRDDLGPDLGRQPLKVLQRELPDVLRPLDGIQYPAHHEVLIDIVQARGQGSELDRPHARGVERFEGLAHGPAEPRLGPFGPE